MGLSFCAEKVIEAGAILHLSKNCACPFGHLQFARK